MSITVLPVPKPAFLDAVAQGGQQAEPLSDETTGVIWLEPKGAADLERVLSEHPRVTWVQLPFAGVDAFIPLFAAYPGITFTSAKGAYDAPVAEHALALTLSALRHLPEFSRLTEWTPQAGRSLFGLRVAVVGAGGIGREIVRLVKAFDTHVTVVRRRPDPIETADETIDIDTFRERLSEYDVVILAAALTAETRTLLGRDEFAALPDTAVVVNIARGPHIDTDALVEALTTGQIAGAGIDVTDPEPLPAGHPLWTAGNIIITPHTANTRAMAEIPLSQRIAANVRAFTGTGSYVGVVDTQAGY